MLVRALLQTSLVLWLAQQTLQGGVGIQPQSVSWGRALPARGVGMGVKPGVAGALGALGSRYGSKAMKTGIGRHPGAQLGAGGYRALGLGGRAGLKQGTPGAYGASLGTGMALGAGLANGMGLGLDQTRKRVYGAGLGTLPGYGALAGIGYPGARPGASAADLGGPELASLGQIIQDLKREKSRALGSLYGRGSILGSSRPDLQGEVKSRDLTAGGVQQQLVPIKPNMRGVMSASSQTKSAKDYESYIQRNQQNPNCGSSSDLSDALEVNQHDLLGLEAQQPQGLVPQPPASEDSKYLGHATPKTQGKKSYPLPLTQSQNVRDLIASLPQGQGTRNHFSVGADRQDFKDHELAKDSNGLRIRGTVAVERHTHGSLNLQVQGRRNYGPVFSSTSGTQGLDLPSVEKQEAKSFTANGQEAKHPSHAERDVIEPKALKIPGQTGRNNQATSYIGGAGNYLGAALGAGGYGAGLGQGAYLGGASRKLGAAAALGQGGYPQTAAGISNGYGEGATGYLGAVAGNGFGADTGAKTLSTGYGNGYSDGYGAALSTGGYGGQVQGAYGALGTGLESTGGKYGGGAVQVPYGSAPVIPTGLEGDGGYPYASQHLSLGAEGAKTTSKYGYGAQLGATQDILGDQAGKNRGLNGYKG